MSNTDYSQMIEKMIAATQFENLKWEKTDPNSDASFTCRIGECKVEISSNYDVMYDDTSYTLALYNKVGEVFNTLRYSLSEGDGMFSSLAHLYNQIRAYYYRIPESEKDIMDALDKLVPF